MGFVGVALATIEAGTAHSMVSCGSAVTSSVLDCDQHIITGRHERIGVIQCTRMTVGKACVEHQPFIPLLGHESMPVMSTQQPIHTNQS